MESPVPLPLRKSRRNDLIYAIAASASIRQSLYTKYGSVVDDTSTAIDHRSTASRFISREQAQKYHGSYEDREEIALRLHEVADDAKRLYSLPEARRKH